MKCRLNERVQTTEAWTAEHRPHLEPGHSFRTRTIEHADGAWLTLHCPCGAKHTTDSEGKEGANVRTT